jgi:hypothetical protein
MNCSDIETTLVGMARNEAVEPSLRNRALVHARSCNHCSELLNAENQLSGWLEALRTGMQAEAASPAVEEALLKEFRASRPASVTPISGASNARRITSQRWVYAAAAALLLAIGLFVAVGLIKPGNSDDQAQNVARPGETSEKPNEEPNEERNQKKDAVQPEEKQRVTPGSKRPEKLSGPQRKRRPNRFYDAVGSNGAPGAPNSRRNNEIATDFLPVAGFVDLADLESGQILRVELPRSALLSFGLPVDPDRASERVKADVLVGGDGVARAIRFVSGSFDYGR